MPYIQHSPDDVKHMLETIGVTSVEDLFAPLPDEVRLQDPLDLPAPLPDMELLAHFQGLAGRLPGAAGLSFLGGGCYDHFIPPAVDHLAGRSEFYTAYTPYQPEASQGVLQVFFEYQTMMAELTGMEVSNASLYDGASALAEAVLCAWAAGKKKRNRVLVSSTIHPEYLETLRTYLHNIDLQVDEIPALDGRTDAGALDLLLGDDVAACAAASPNAFGIVEDLGPLVEKAHGGKSLFIALADPVGLGILRPPGAVGADIVVGEGQGLGNPMSFGGPHFGFIAASRKLVRNLPGRIVGQTEDGEGRRGFVLTFQTREQHIRREKATSNICTNQALCALRATIHLALLGPKGLWNTAARCTAQAHALAEKLTALDGVSLAFPGPFFKEFTVRLPCDADTVIRRLARRGIFAGPGLGAWDADLSQCMLVAATEKRTDPDLETFTTALAEELQHL